MNGDGAKKYYSATVELHYSRLAGRNYGVRSISENSQLDSGHSKSELQSAGAAQLDYVLDLRAVLGAILKWSWIIVLFSAVGIVYGVLASADFVPKFTAKMTISEQTSAGGISNSSPASSGSAIQTSLIAALSGSSSSSGGMFQRLKFAFNSQQLAKRLDERHNLSREIFAKRWDSEKGDRKTVEKTEPTFRQRLLAYLHQDQSVLRGTEALARAVGGMVEMTQIDKTEFWEISISHTDRETALRWLEIIFSSADRLLRDQDREKMQEQIRFLQTRTEKAELAGFRAALYGVLINQEKNLHMLDSDLSYAADIIEPAFASELKTMPNLTKTIVFPAFGGGFLGLMIALLISVFFRE